jgi:type VI protein secretion system component VasF
MNSRNLLAALIAVVAAVVALGGCSSSTDAWIDEQAERLTAHGITFRPNRPGTP